MVEKRVKIKNKAGLHAKLAVILAERAMKFDCKIQIIKGSSQTSAKSIMGLMSLGLACSTEILLKAEGVEAEQAVASICNLIDSRFEA